MILRISGNLKLALRIPQAYDLYKDEKKWQYRRPDPIRSPKTILGDNKCREAIAKAIKETNKKK